MKKFFLVLVSIISLNVFSSLEDIIILPFEDNVDLIQKQRIKKALRVLNYSKIPIIKNTDIKKAYYELMKNENIVNDFGLPASFIKDVNEAYLFLNNTLDLQKNEYIPIDLLELGLELDLDAILHYVKNKPQSWIDTETTGCLFALGFNFGEEVTISNIVSKMNKIEQDFQQGKISEEKFDDCLDAFYTLNIFEQAKRIPEKFYVTMHMNSENTDLYSKYIPDDLVNQEVKKYLLAFDFSPGQTVTLDDVRQKIEEIEKSFEEQKISKELYEYYQAVYDWLDIFASADRLKYPYTIL